MSKKTSTRRFNPRLWPTLGTVVGFILLVGLGTWQTDRYFDKLEVEAERAEHVHDDPVTIDSFEQFVENANPYSPVLVQGSLDPDYVFLFKHRARNSQPGYWLGGLVRFARGPGVLIVNRGWIPLKAAKDPAIHEPDPGPQNFKGIVYQPKQVIADDDTRASLKSGKLQLKMTPADKPVEWETYDIAGISEALHLKTPTPPTVLVLGPDHTEQPYPIASLDYVTKPYMTSERHLGYATFWFLTALGLLAMYFANAFGVLSSGRHRPAPND